MMAQSTDEQTLCDILDRVTHGPQCFGKMKFFGVHVGPFGVARRAANWCILNARERCSQTWKSGSPVCRGSAGRPQRCPWSLEPVALAQL